MCLLPSPQIYRILGKTVVCYPIVFDLSDFYLSQDVMLLIDDIKNALQFIKHSWKMKGRPLFLVLIKGSRFNPVLDWVRRWGQSSHGQTSDPDIKSYCGAVGLPLCQ